MPSAQAPGTRVLHRTAGDAMTAVQPARYLLIGEGDRLTLVTPPGTAGTNLNALRGIVRQYAPPRPTPGRPDLVSIPVTPVPDHTTPDPVRTWLVAGGVLGLVVLGVIVYAVIAYTAVVVGLVAVTGGAGTAVYLTRKD